MAATKDLTAVTLQLEVKNGGDKNDQPKFKNTWIPKPRRTIWRKWAKNSAD